MMRKIVSDGRIVIPRAIRDKLELYPGQEMDIILTEDKKSILIRPIEQLKVCVNYGNCIAIFHEKTGRYLSHSKDRVVYLNIERV